LNDDAVRGGRQGEIVVGLIAAPGAAARLTERVLGRLSERLGATAPQVRWTVTSVVDGLVEAPTDLTRLILAARRRLLASGWDLAVCVTDLPLQTARRPIVAHASASHAVAVLSLPALGPVGVQQRAVETLGRLVQALLANGDKTAVRELGARVNVDAHGIGLLAGVVTGNLRLLLGMLRANRPWRLAVRLSRALIGALAAGVLALVSSDTWQLAAAAGPVRLALLTAGSVFAVVLAIVVGAHLWEPVPRDPGMKEQVVLFNVVTVLTVLIGVLAMYCALLVATGTGTLLLVPVGHLSEVLGRPASADDVIAVAWLATSLATVGGALGAGLESDEAVREAAYGYQGDTELT
jgi:hypothetical protein